MHDFMTPDAPRMHVYLQSDGGQGSPHPAVEDVDVLDSWQLLKQATQTVRAVSDRLHDPARPGKLRDDVPLREAKDALTAVSTMLRAIRDSQELIRQQMSEKLFRRAVTELLKELSVEAQQDFLARLRDIEADLKARTAVREAA